MSQRKEIAAYLLENPIDRSNRGAYDEASKRFGVDTETVRRVWRSLRRAGKVEQAGEAKLFVQKKADSAPIYEQQSTFKKEGNKATISKSTNKEIKNEQDLAKECEIDLQKWNITQWECKRYNAWIKNKAGEIESQPKYSVWAKMVLREVETDLQLQKEVILKELKAYVPKTSKFNYGDFKEADCLLELAMFDLHLGKVANKGEAEENYDLKIAEKRFKTAVQELLKRVNLNLVGRILLPIGQDLIHFDNIKATTFNETQMETDTRFHKLVRVAKRILVETIDELALIAPVDVVVVVGNHDTTVSFMIGEILDAWYNNNPNVNINNSPRLRKYYKFGKNGFQFSHGDLEKHLDLGMIFATEEPQMWAATEYRQCQLGHFHKQKKTNYVSVDSHQGFQVKILPSLSSQDRWHYSKGYCSLKQAKAYLYSATEGEIAEYTYTA